MVCKDELKNILKDELKDELMSAKMTTTYRVGSDYMRYKEQEWPYGIRLYKHIRIEKFKIYCETAEAFNKWETMKGREKSSKLAYKILTYLSNL